MPHSPEKVWRALTQGPLIEEWLMANDFPPVVDHKFTFRAAPMAHWNGVTDCDVLVVEPNETLAYSWKLECVGRRSGQRTENRRHVAAHADPARRARAHGAKRLRA